MSIFAKLFQKEKESAPKVQEIKKLRPFPFTVDGANLRFAYDMDLAPTAPRSIETALGNMEKVVDVNIVNGKLALLCNGNAFAIISDDQKQRMVEDYLRRGDPVNAVLRENGKANLRFYRDMRKYSTESETTELMSYKSKSCQETIYPLASGEELGCYEENGKIVVCTFFGQEPVGKMPAKIARRAEDNNIRAIYVEEIREEIDDEGEITYIPVVRVYW